MEHRQGLGSTAPETLLPAFAFPPSLIGSPARCYPASLDPNPSLSHPPSASFSVPHSLYPSSHLPFGQPLQQNGPYLFCDSLAQSHLPDVPPWPWPPSSRSSSSSSGRKRGWRTRAADPGVAAPGGDLSLRGTSSIPEALAFAPGKLTSQAPGQNRGREWDQLPSPCLQKQLRNSRRGSLPAFCPISPPPSETRPPCPQPCLLRSGGPQTPFPGACVSSQRKGAPEPLTRSPVKATLPALSCGREVLGDPPREA